MHPVLRILENETPLCIRSYFKICNDVQDRTIISYGNFSFLVVGRCESITSFDMVNASCGILFSIYSQTLVNMCKVTLVVVNPR